jgi:chromosome segregation ATPase
MGALALRRERSGGLSVADMASDASLLADYGEPPGHWLLSGLYALRVLRKQREIKAALVGRREEAARAATALEDAQVAFAERVKPAAQNVETYANLLAEARKADELLRSRDAVLAADQDAHRARLAAVASRLAALEAEVSSAQGAERAIATEIASNQGALGRAEAKLKRAESELRAAAREGVGSES